MKKQWENGHSSFDLEIIIWALELIDDVYVEPLILEINLTEKSVYISCSTTSLSLYIFCSHLPCSKYKKSTEIQDWEMMY